MLERLLAWQTLLDLCWLLFLLLILRYFWRDRKALAETKNWIKTRGRIIHCEWTQEGRTLWPEIEYVFEANEKEYRGHYLFLDTSHNTAYLCPQNGLQSRCCF